MSTECYFSKCKYHSCNSGNPHDEGPFCDEFECPPDAEYLKLEQEISLEEGLLLYTEAEYLTLQQQLATLQEQLRASNKALIAESSLYLDTKLELDETIKRLDKCSNTLVVAEARISELYNELESGVSQDALNPYDKK